MVFNAASNSVAIDADGYLVDPTQWDEQVALQLAQQEQLALTDEHWKVFHFMRAFYDEHQVAADARFVMKFLAEELGYGAKAHNHLFKLFPYGYVKQACKIAGMKRPRGWSTG